MRSATRTPLSASSSPCLGSGDVVWDTVLRSLPVPLQSALQTAELDHPGVLLNYPQMEKNALQVTLQGVLAELGDGQGRLAVLAGPASRKVDRNSTLEYIYDDISSLHRRRWFRRSRLLRRLEMRVIVRRAATLEPTTFIPGTAGCAGLVFSPCGEGRGRELATQPASHVVQTLVPGHVFEDR